MLIASLYLLALSPPNASADAILVTALNKYLSIESNVSSFLKTIDDLPNYSRKDGKIFYDPTPGVMFSGDKRVVRADDPIFRDYEGGQEFYDIFYDPKGIR